VTILRNRNFLWQRTLNCSVADPWPDPYLWLSDPAPDPTPDPAIFVSDLQEGNKSFFAYYFSEGTLPSFFNDIKS